MAKDPSDNRTTFSPILTAAAVAAGLSGIGLALLPETDTLAGWKALGDLYLSLWTLLFVILLAGQWLALGAARPRRQCLPATDTELSAESRGETTAVPRRHVVFWAAALLAVCSIELATHAGERNGFVASSRPASGVEQWTVADGYATLLDGIPAQGDGLHLLDLLGLFLGDRPPSPSEFDRRAGHLFLVSLFVRPLGAYWGFAAVNLLSWWAAAMCVWWLGLQRWPGSVVPWLASLLTATGHGFLFMAAAPQAHAPAFAAFAGVLVLADRLRLWGPRTQLSDWARLGWATGAAGLIYFVQIPCLLFLWLYGLGQARLAGLFAASVVALGVVQAWQWYGGALLGLSFAGGNNDLAGAAIQGWMRILGGGVVHLLGQLHVSSLRGLLGGAFYYPWWLLAALGLALSSPPQRRWALAVILAAAIPAIVFTTRFNLPRLGYFMYPAIYLLAARGIEGLAQSLGHHRHRLRAGNGSLTRPQWVVATAVVLILIGIANIDLLGVQQLNLWFHYSQGTGW